MLHYSREVVTSPASKVHSWPATRLPRLPSSFGVAVHVVAGRTCSSGIVRSFEDPDSLVPRQGPWHELQLKLELSRSTQASRQGPQEPGGGRPLHSVWGPVLTLKKKAHD